MKTIRFLSVSLLVLSLFVGIFTFAATPVHAAGTNDIDESLAKILGISAAELSNYASNYKASLPIDYVKKTGSIYVSLGGDTAYGRGANSLESGFSDLIAGKYGFEYDVDYLLEASENGLSALGAVSYINDRSRSKVIKTADLITFQIDGVALLAATKATAESVVVSGGTLDWNKYVTDPATLQAIRDFCTTMTNEYTADFGASNAKAIADVMECMLYECVVYGNETMNAVSAIRTLNSNAVILVLGLHNPLRGLTLTANGTTINISNMVDDMIKVCNAYLLKQTKDLKNIAFIDISGATANGFGNIQLDMNNTSDASSKLMNILSGDGVRNQYVNQAGHDYIANQVATNVKAPCKHASTTISGKKDATCTEKGYTGDTVCKDCGKTVKKGSDVPVKDHAWQAGEVTKKATCTEKGAQTYTCKDCGKSTSKELAATGHAWKWAKTDKEATCTAKGKATYECSTCKATEVRDIAMKNHTYGEGTVVKEPTCTSKGMMSYACTGCGKTKTEDMPIIDHSWDEGKITTEPTCKAEGVKTFTCSGCSATRTEPVPVSDHHWNEGEVTTQPACNAEGVKTFTCADCGETKTDSIPVSDHHWNEGEITTQPGCGTEGVKTFTCADCGETKTESIPAEEHQFGEHTSNGDATCQADGTKTAVCEKCGAKDTIADPNTKTDHKYENGVCVHCQAEEPKEPSDPIGWIVALSVISLGGIGAVIFVLLKKGIIKLPAKQ